MSTLMPPNPDRAAMPSGFIRVDVSLTQEEAAEFARRFFEATKRGRSRVIWRPACRRTRIRLAVRRRVDKACGWLCEHHCDPAAVLIWRVCGMWRR